MNDYIPCTLKSNCGPFYCSRDYLIDLNIRVFTGSVLDKSLVFVLTCFVGLLGQITGVWSTVSIVNICTNAAMLIEHLVTIQKSC